MKLKKQTENQNTKSEEQRLKEDAELMRMHYGMLLDHHIIDFDMFESKVGKENVPEILQEYNKILMKGELEEYELPDFIGICHHENVNCPLQELCLVGFKCNHEHEHSNAKMCYMNKPGGELETFLLKNNTSVPKLLEMERTIAEKKQETGKVPPAREIEEAHADRIQQLIDEYETAYQAFNLIKDKNAVMHIARMQQQIDTFKAALLHINERINNGNKCNLVYIEPLDDNDKHIINNIVRFIDEHSNNKQENEK